MKYIKVVILSVFICSFLSFQTTDSLVGTWELYKMQDADGSEKETSGRWMAFLADGVLEGGNSPGKTDRTGKWTYDEATKQLSIESERKLSGEGTFPIEWIDAKTITLDVGSGRKVFLKKKTEK